jgi:monoamine oxidase
VGGDFGKQLEHKGSAVALEFAKEKLRKVYGKKVDREFAGGRFTRWTKDRYAKGAYSCALPGKQQMRRALSKPVEDRIFFIGEACHEKWAAYATGAYLSGISTANVIAARLGGN